MTQDVSEILAPLKNDSDPKVILIKGYRKVFLVKRDCLPMEPGIFAAKI